MQETCNEKNKDSPPNETVTYRINGKSFIVQPVFKEDAKITVGEILLRLMEAEVERKS